MKNRMYVLYCEGQVRDAQRNLNIHVPCHILSNKFCSKIVAYVTISPI